MPDLNSNAALVRFFVSLAECLPTSVAQEALRIPIDFVTDERLEYLREAANQGQLSAAESAEYENLVEANDIISLFRLKLRQRISSADSSPCKSTLTVGQLNEFIASLPKLGDDSEAFARDVEAVRREFST